MSTLTSHPADALANLYGPAAERVLATWKPGRLERRAAQLHSSQALCVSLWETIAAGEEQERWRLVRAILDRARLLAPEAPAALSVEAEVRQYGAILGEVGGGTPTSLDALVRWPYGVISVESKFAEREFGGCGQYKNQALRPGSMGFEVTAADGKPARGRLCTGFYGPGSDRGPTHAGHQQPCRLMVPEGKRKPRRYWEVVPDLFVPEAAALGQPCPFRGDAYQLMRNLAFAHEMPSAGPPGPAPGFAVLVTVVDRSPAAPKLKGQVEAFRALLRPGVQDRVAVLSYEAIADEVEGAGAPGLAGFLRTRIDAVAAKLGWD